MLSSPGSRSKIWEALHLKIGKAGENRGQIVAHVDVDTVTGFDDAEDGSDLGAAGRLEFSARLLLSASSGIPGSV